MFSLPLERCMFSCPESYLTLGVLDREHYPKETVGLGEGIYIRQLYGAEKRQCLKLSLLDNQQIVPCSTSATPSHFLMNAGGREIRWTFADEHCIAGEGVDCGVRIEMEPVTYEYAARLDDTHVLLNSSASKIQFLISVFEGQLRMDAPYGEQGCQYMKIDILPDAQSGRICLSIEDFQAVMPSYRSTIDVKACEKSMDEAFRTFVAQFPALNAPYRDAQIEALYVMWSCIVAPCGHLTRHAVLMSNNWMPNVWTWDSVINGMALVLGDSALAKEQFFASLDLQTPEGLLPDYINPMEVLWNFTKPPIHGIAMLNGMMDVMDPQELETAYVKMQRQTDYWLKYMDSDGDGIPQYNHGNDCGWDNCTPFRIGPPIEGPDLSAYIILQMHALDQMSKKLGRQERDWLKEAERQLTRLLDHSFKDGRFCVYQSGTHREYAEGDSLYPYMPLVLGRHMPKAIFDSLIAELKEEGRFRTPVGLASESLRSAYYEPDSYWRGPVWPSVMLLLVQGIADGGERSFAQELAVAFCDCIRKNGFAENFNAVTGEGLRDPAHTWTAAAYLALACRYMK